MDLRESLTDELPASATAPSSPTRSPKQLLTRSASASPELNSHDVSLSGAPLPTLQLQETHTSPTPARDGSECGDVLGDGLGLPPKLGHSRRSQWDVVPNLPRSQTFARQQSELRQNLLEVLPTSDERRAASVDRRLSRSVSSPSNPHGFVNPRSSAPSISHHRDPSARGISVPRQKARPESIPPVPPLPTLYIPDEEPLPDHASVAEDHVEDHIEDHEQVLDDLALSPQRLTFEEDRQSECLSHEVYARDHSREPYLIDTSHMTTSEYDQRIRFELENIWILNLSMHFRDRSRREKFFVTYRQRPEQSRRVTISLDYRNAPEGSLEMDLMETKVQRDKNEMIYEAIRESLIDIQFYDTVTNLKLQTTEGRLHVHVVEDVTEIIDYPSGNFVHHLGCRKIRERDVEFESHMSGFVYKVRVDGRTLIKKEIPGPDSVDEFLYEVNALNFLRGSHNVIELYGVVMGDDDRVKGLLISYAEQGALIDILYENNHGIPWPTRMKWARQIVHGLSEVHEAGFVQGDFTLSNIVIDDFGNAKIIDINRRGCPVGWEPPEATPLIQSEQRISMYIGVKSDLYQLGMVLWSLATQNDDPEAHGRPLILEPDVGVPRWYRTIVETCLADDPRVRAQAQQLLSCFPNTSSISGRHEDSDYDDEWVGGPHHPTFYAQSVPSGSLTDGPDSYGHKAGIESAATSDYNPEDIEHLPPGKGGLMDDKFSEIVPRIKSVTPSNEWSYVNLGHTYVDPMNGVSNEPYYYPMRGRSPPSASRIDTRNEIMRREGYVAQRCPTPPQHREELQEDDVHDQEDDLLAEAGDITVHEDEEATLEVPKGADEAVVDDPAADGDDESDEDNDTPNGVLESVEKDVADDAAADSDEESDEEDAPPNRALNIVEEAVAENPAADSDNESASDAEGSDDHNSQDAHAGAVDDKSSEDAAPNGILKGVGTVVGGHAADDDTESSDDESDSTSDAQPHVPAVPTAPTEPTAAKNELVEDDDSTTYHTSDEDSDESADSEEAEPVTAAPPVQAPARAPNSESESDDSSDDEYFSDEGSESYALASEKQHTVPLERCDDGKDRDKHTDSESKQRALLST